MNVFFDLLIAISEIAIFIILLIGIRKYAISSRAIGISVLMLLLIMMIVNVFGLVFISKKISELTLIFLLAYLASCIPFPNLKLGKTKKPKLELHKK